MPTHNDVIDRRRLSDASLCRDGGGLVASSHIHQVHHQTTIIEGQKQRILSHLHGASTHQIPEASAVVKRVSLKLDGKG
jgi:hypothetical protein